MLDQNNMDDVNDAIEIVDTKPDTLTTVAIAKDRNMNPKSLRARIRRNIDAWEPLFFEGKRHVFKNNKTIRGKIEKLLA